MSVKGKEKNTRNGKETVSEEIAAEIFPELVIIMNLQYNISQKRGGKEIPHLDMLQ